MEQHRENLCELVRTTLIQLLRENTDFQSSIEIDGLIGITIDHSNIFLVKVSECTAVLPQDPRPRKKPRTRGSPQKGQTVPRKSPVIHPPPVVSAAAPKPPVCEETAASVEFAAPLVPLEPIVIKSEVCDMREVSVVSSSPVDEASPSSPIRPELTERQQARRDKQRARAKRHRQYMRELAQRPVLTAEEHQRLTSYRVKNMQRGRAFRERRRQERLRLLEMAQQGRPPTP